MPGTRGGGTFFLNGITYSHGKRKRVPCDIKINRHFTTDPGGCTQSLANCWFCREKDLATYLAVKPVTIDKLIHQGLVSGGTSGIVEGRHYCRLDPRDNNSSNFLFDATRVMADAWSNFSNYGTDGDV